jgi:2,3-bisphosphoglycerate-independent phosphoglycerate mutase
MGDSRYKELGGKTPLEKAKTPNMDFLAKEGKVGMMWPIAKNIAPESDQAMISLLGFDPFKTYTGRGVLEAYGSGIKINGVVCRCNFSAETNKGIITKVQGATEQQVKEYAKKLSDDRIKIIPTVGYRAVMIIKTKSSPRVSNTHPGYKVIKNYVTNALPIAGRKLRVLRCKPLEKNAEETAMLINKFTKKVESHLKNKTMLMRGCGNRLPKLEKLKGRWALLADMPVEKGIGRIVGMKILPKSQDLKKTFNTIKNNFNKYDNFYLQIKGPDAFAHQGDVHGKVKAIEKVDREFIGRIKELDAITCVTADHSTECRLKAHSKLPVPLLIYGKGKDRAKGFGERECSRGMKVYGRQLLSLLKDNQR